MAEIKKLNTTTNETDPIVVFDPTFLKTTVTMSWMPQNKSEETKSETGKYITETDPVRIDGIKHPIIKINSHIIIESDIVSCKLLTVDVLPSLELIIRKGNYLSTDTPGFVNKITVILIPPEDGTYRKISVDFYISSMVIDKGNIVYKGSYFSPTLRKRYTKAISDGTSNKLTTYQLFEQIAKENKFGFAATNQCKEINDTRARLCRNQTILDVMEEHIKFGGIDNNSFFTYWIDVYGNIVLCNLSWVLSKAVQFNDLSIKKLSGVNTTDSTSAPINTVKFTDDTFRSLSNVKYKDEVEANIIQTYTWVINNSNIKYAGTNNTYYIVDHVTNNGNNSIISETITIEDDTEDGKNFKEAYNFENNEFLGVELGFETDGNTPVLLQEQRRISFLTKLNAKKLKVTLKNPHLGLQRGTLINIVIYEYDRVAKSTLLNNAQNIDPSNKEAAASAEAETIDKETLEKILDDPEVGVPNLTVSGMYYISGIEYTYTKTYGILQTLVLLRKSPTVSYFNYSSFVKNVFENKK